MRSVGKHKDYAKKTLGERWAMATLLVWVWEAVTVVPAALLSLQWTGADVQVSWWMLLGAALLVGPASYLLLRYFYRLVNFTIVHSDNRLLRILTVWTRSIIGLAWASVLVWGAVWLIDWLCQWLPVGLAYAGATISLPQLHWREQFWSSPLWWPAAQIVAVFLPAIWSQVWLILVDDPHIDLLGSLRQSAGMMKDHYKDYYRDLGSFWTWILVAVALGIGFVRFAESGLDYWFGWELADWMYMVGVAIMMGPVVAYMGIVLVCFFNDAKDEYLHARQPIQKSAVPTGLEQTPARSRDQIQQALADSMYRRQLGAAAPVNQGNLASQDPSMSVSAMPSVSATPTGYQEQTNVDLDAQTSGQQVSDYAAPVGEAMMGEVPFSGNF